MTAARAEIYILYQMGASEEWTWFSPIGVFFSESALWEHVKQKGITLDRKLREPSANNEVHLSEPQDYVVVLSREGEVPEVELDLQA